VWERRGERSDVRVGVLMWCGVALCDWVDDCTVSPYISQ
jgi:hypothetical protein